MQGFQKLVNWNKRQVFIVKSTLTLPKDEDITSQQLELLSIFYNFPSKYKGLFDQIEIDYPLNYKKGHINLMFYLI